MQMPSGASLLPATETLLFLIWMAGADLDSERQVVVLKVVGSNPTAVSYTHLTLPTSDLV